MRWFRHISKSRHDERLKAIIREYGMEGYGLYWLILETIADNMKPKSNNAYYIATTKDWCESAKMLKPKFMRILNGIINTCETLDKLFEKCGESQPILIATTLESYLKIECPNLLKYRDEWGLRQNKNSGVTREELVSDSPPQNTDNIYTEFISKGSESLNALDVLKKDLKDSCSEQKNESAPEPEPVPEIVVIELPLNDGSMYPITESVIADMSELYPAVNMLQEFRNMKGWLVNNPKKRKTLRGIKSFYNTWLHKEQNRGHPEITSKQKQPSNDQYKLLP